MITDLHIRNFKSWKGTGRLRLAPLTVFFGTNSSGKSSIMQFLLMLKQSVESTDRKRVLHTGDDLSIVDVGTYSNLIYCHDAGLTLGASIRWRLPETLKIRDPEKKHENLFEVDNLEFDTEIEGKNGVPIVRKFSYFLNENVFGMERYPPDAKKGGYKLISQNYQTVRQPGRPWPLPSPIKFYGFPDQANAFFQNVGFLSDFVLELEGLFGRMAYLGPLRDYPKRIYTWAGEEPPAVGRKGELAVAAILSARRRGKYISPGRHKKKLALEERIAYWLRKMGVIHSFSVKPIATDRKEYEVEIRKAEHGPSVPITDVGFGLSQVLPVLVLCYYVKKGSVLLLEQPELHLHPSAQAWLADVFIEVVNNLGVQLIVESHSEHFLRRLQRRIAEEEIDVDKTALYFCRIQDSSSKTEKLNIDLFGDIANWPKDFFGDELGELAAKTEAAMDRQL